MATDLTGLKVKDTYNSLLKIGDNSSLSATPDKISDGFGNESVLYLSTSQVSIGALPATGYDLTVGNSGIKTQIIDIVGAATAASVQLTGGSGSQGTLSWNTDEETVDIIQNGATLQVGQEVQVHVKNQTGSTITDGTPVYVTGTLGASGRLTVAPMIADGSIEAKYFLGVTTEDIPNGEDGKVTTFGKIRGLDTTAYSEGQTLFVSASTAGEFQITAPVSPNLDLEVAIVINVSANNGTIFVRATNGQYLGLLHDVYLNGVSDKDLLVYDNANSRWSNSKTIGDLSAGNLTLSGYLRGAANFVIDPAAYGDETGVVQILGDLRVDGTTTTINSTTVTIDDKNLVLASGSATAADANGAGITIDGADATMTYNSTSDRFVFNKNIETDLVGNADTASTLETARNIAVDGAVTGNADFDGSGNITITTSVNHNHDADYVNVTGDTMTGDLDFNDDVQARFGTGDDLKLYHNGLHSFIDNATNALYIRNVGTDAGDDIIFVANDTNDSVRGYIRINTTDGAVQISHHDGLRLATTDTGIDVTGDVTANAYYGDGSNLTGVLTSLNFSGIDGITLRDEDSTTDSYFHAKVDYDAGLYQVISNARYGADYIQVDGSDTRSNTVFAFSPKDSTTTNPDLFIGGDNSVTAPNTLTDWRNIKMNASSVQINGNEVATRTWVSSNTTLQDVTDNGATTTNDIIIDGHLSILDTHSLYMFGENNAKINIDARGSGTGAMLHKWNRNTDDTQYLPYYENWYDGNSYHEIGVESDTWRIGTRSGTSVLYVGDLDASTNGALDANKQGIVIQGTGGRLDNPQDGTERLPTLQFFDSVTNYGSGTATAGELRGGVEWYTSETSSNFPAISGAIYSVNENTYNTQMGLAFYTNYNGSSPTEKLRIGGAGEVNIVSGDLRMGGTTVINSSRNATFNNASVTNQLDAGSFLMTGVSWNSGDFVISGNSPNIEFRDTDSSSYYWQLGANGKTFYILHDTNRDGSYESTFPFYVSSDTSVGYLYGSRIFADNYHPNADKWTSARTITLGGDLTGSVSIDGSSNVTLSAQVVNDSHTHDSRYYTEAESERITARALGWVPAYGNADESTVFWNETEQAVQLQSSSDSSIGMAYKAIRMKAGDVVRLTVMARSAFAATGGFYLRIYYHNGDLPDGKTHVSNDSGNSSSWVQEDDSGDTSWWENNALGTSWTNFERTYTAPADGYMSLVILNWTGIGTGAIYVKQPDIQFEKVNQATSADLASDAQLLDGINSTQFLRSDTSDTATGNYTFNGNLYVNNTNTASKALYVRRTTADSQSLRIHVNDSEAVFTSIQDENSGAFGSFVFNLDSGATDPTFDVRYGSSTIARFRENLPSFFGMSSDIGIGTTNPENKVHIDWSTNSDLLLEIDNQNTGSASTAGILLRGQGNNFYLRNLGDGTSLPNSTEFKSTAGGGNFRFNLGGNEVVRMTGTGVPLQVNHINSNPTLFIGRASGIASIKGGASGDGHLILDSSNNSHAVWCQHYTSGNVYLATGGGNVGINTTTTSEKLTVAGGISLTGNLEFGSSNGKINLSRGSFITFYEGGNASHGIGSRNNGGSEADDIRINSYGAVYINLDSNNNNTSGADFIIGRHGGATGSIVNNRFKVDGETGAGTFAGDVIAFGSPSDISLKENIKPIEGALDKVKKLQGVTFDWKQNDDDILKIKEDYGFIAQEVQEVLPELVRENENGKLSLRDKGIISVLVEAIKEQQKHIDELKAKLDGSTN